MDGRIQSCRYRLLFKFMSLSILAALALSCRIDNSVQPDEPNQSESTLPVIDIISENCESRDGHGIDMIVLHHTGSSVDAFRIAHFFQDLNAQVSAHYIIDRNGAIIRSVPDNLSAWHSGNSFFDGSDNVNQRSIGIELCNLGDNSEDFSYDQVESLIKLMADISRQYNIPSTRFVRHRDVAVPAGRKIDTADNLDVAAVYASVENYIVSGFLDVPPAAPVSRSLSRENARLYKVVKGDTYEYISWLIYDSPALADSIRTANQNRDLIPGDSLYIPENPFDLFE